MPVSLNLSSALLEDQIEEDIAIADGYTSYFSFCKTRQGYSGNTPLKFNGQAVRIMLVGNNFELNNY